MKLLCIEYDSFIPPKLHVGEIYTYTGQWQCATCKNIWYTVAEVPGPSKPTTGHCPRCLTKIDCPSTLWHFFAKRFVPWNPDQFGINEEEVKELFTPSPNPLVPHER